MPVVQLFCLFTTVALFMDFVYQLTFFSAMMSFIVRRQIRLDEKAKERKIQDGNPSMNSIGDSTKAKFGETMVSTYLATEVSTDFNMENLYLEGSPLTDISRQMQDFVLRESFVVSFAVKPMPDFSDERTRERFNEMVTKLETLPKYGWGPEATVFWLRDYNTTIQFWEEEEDHWSPEVLLKNYRDMEDGKKNTLLHQISAASDVQCPKKASTV
ncbi:hypothetical protein COOONC_21891 [Cooperia oncophora]